MRTHNYKKQKKTNSVKEAREIKKHLEALDFDFQMFATGNYTEKSPQDGTPWHLTSGKGQQIQKLGHKYVYVQYDGKEHKIEPDKSEYSSNGEIVFYIY